MSADLQRWKKGLQWDIKYFANSKKAHGADAIDAVFIVLNLLK